MIKLLTIVGARPQFIKAAPLSKAIQETEGVEEILIHTGQHFDSNMSDIFFSGMGIPEPHYKLDINSLGHGAMTGRMLEEVEAILLKEKPNAVVVYGDTNSTLAGALAASKIHIPVAHIEAGLRSFNMKMPEEVNRILTDRISRWLFCPTQSAVDNLNNEGYDNLDIEVVKTGDIMLDASKLFAETSASHSTLDQSLKEAPYILSTIHREENTNDIARLTNIVNAVNEITEFTCVILPLHPRTRKILADHNLTLNATVIDPVGYLEILDLLQGAEMVMTDSGGMQKEAYFFSKPCVTMRDETEWIELVDNKYNQLVGANKAKIIKAVNEALAQKIDNSDQLYGDGNTAVTIVNRLVADLS